MVFLQVESVDDIELSSGPESEKTLASKAITISKGGLWGAGWVGVAQSLALKEYALPWGPSDTRYGWFPLS